MRAAEAAFAFGNILFHDIFAHRVVACLLQKRHEVREPRPLDRLAEQAAADAAEPRAVQLVAQRVAGRNGLRRKALASAQSPDPGQVGRFLIRISAAHGQRGDHLVDRAGKRRLFSGAGQRADRVDQGLERLDIQPLFKALRVLGLQVFTVQLPRMDGVIVGLNGHECGTPFDINHT